MKRIVVGLLAVCLLGSLTVLAEEKAATAEKAVKKEAALQEITVTGKLEPAKNPKAGFSLKEADGTIVKIAAPRAAKEGETVLNLEKFAGKDVKLVGMGVTKEVKGKKMTHIKTVTSIEEAAAAAPAVEPAAAPAAPAAAPEAK